MTEPAARPAEATEHPTPPSFPQEALTAAGLGQASLPEVRTTLAERAKPYLDELKAQGFPDTPFIDQSGERVQATYNHDGQVTSITALDPAAPYAQKNFHQFSFNKDGSLRDGKDWDSQGNGEMLLSRNHIANLVVFNHQETNGAQTMIKVPYSGDKPGTPKDIQVRVVPPN